ncbi:DUF2163 domain-containing protein [Falsigemmobacter faecalis]|uniref:DUF2163 domain-containing protein n=1 Tax=Falsigemmobacter faecalis TaxID=2488730 RepID=A0A3P3DV33_9RHOB|nr:DUF2163 domain-containing protein [Falsigemmobacter faecalis]RRH77312.1 DUF2163 domain-containing protein [Falsigemmobacter faecalis]
MSGLRAHLEGGCTTLSRCWKITRSDGRVLGFTDHDFDLEFAGCRYEASSGLTARALSRTTGLSADNSEALGALQSAALSEVDLRAGRYDGARVEVLLVNWADVRARQLLFAGTLGEISRAEGAFRAELRGLSEALGQVQDRIYQRSCTAALGDALCRVDLSNPAYRLELEAGEIREGRIFRFDAQGFEDRWFERGVLRVLSGAGAGLSGMIRNDRQSGPAREVELWDRLAAEIAPGDRLELTAGCDRQAASCRGKFGNFLNFRGFPHLPSEDWLTAVPGRQI